MVAILIFYFIKHYMVKIYSRGKTKSCLKFSVVALSILVAGTALGNQVSAAEVHPTISTQSPIISDEAKEVASWLRSRFVTFVKEWLETSTSKNKYDFRAKDTIKVNKNEVISLESESPIFIDMEQDPNRYYAESLAKKWIISKSQKFYPNNFIRLNEVAKMIVNSYRFKVGYDIEWNAWLTDKVYFAKAMPKYYNTAYEMWIFEWIENLEDFERFVSYNDFNKILKNFKAQYPDLVNLYYMDIKESNANLKRWEVARTIFRTMMIDSEESYSFEDIAYNEYGADVQLLADNWIIASDERFNPEADVSRKDFILWLVKTHLKHSGEHVENRALEQSLADLDYEAEYAPYILLAKNEWWVDYLVETVRWQDYLNLNSKVTQHEACYIISKLTWITFDYDIISADKKYITRWEVASLLNKAYKLPSAKKAISGTQYQNDSHIWRLIENIKGLANWWKRLAIVS